jgi:hypothetical protein
MRSNAAKVEATVKIVIVDGPRRREDMDIDGSLKALPFLFRRNRPRSKIVPTHLPRALMEKV